MLENGGGGGEKRPVRAAAPNASAAVWVEGDAKPCAYLIIVCLSQAKERALA